MGEGFRQRGQQAVSRLSGTLSLSLPLSSIPPLRKAARATKACNIDVQQVYNQVYLLANPVHQRLQRLFCS